MFRPSCEGTSATSLISWVCTDIRITRVIGTTRCTPEGRTRDETEPKKSRTPTFPAGITTRGLKKAKKKTRANSRRNRRRPRNPPEAAFEKSTTLTMATPSVEVAGATSAGLAAPDDDLPRIREIELLCQRVRRQSRHA